MSRIRFGFRSIFNKKYDINQFDFLVNDLNKYNEAYRGIDLWNSKEANIKNLQVEKRIEYFHFMYIPVFPVGKVWTLRKEDGKLYDLESVKYRIEDRLGKSYYPLYTFLFPILILISILVFFLSIYGKKYYSEYQRDNDKKERKAELISELNNTKLPFYLVFDKPHFSANMYQRVDSIVGDVYFMSKLPAQIDTFKYRTYDNIYYSAFKQHKLIHFQVPKDSIYSLIHGNTYFHEDYELKKILSILDLETPKLEIDFDISGLNITNLGKPITFLDFEDNSSVKNQWKFQTNSFLDTGKSIRGEYLSKMSMSESKLNLVFSDNNDFFEYEIQGTYLNSEGTVAFINKSVKELK